MNLRPSGYEPDELPGCSTPRQSIHPAPPEFTPDLIRGAGVVRPSPGLAPCPLLCVHREEEMVEAVFRLLTSAICALPLAGLAATYSPKSS